MAKTLKHHVLRFHGWKKYEKMLVSRKYPSGPVRPQNNMWIQMGCTQDDQSIYRRAGNFDPSPWLESL
jgi:hypothetical protein